MGATVPSVTPTAPNSFPPPINEAPSAQIAYQLSDPSRQIITLGEVLYRLDPQLVQAVITAYYVGV